MFEDKTEVYVRYANTPYGRVYIDKIYQGYTVNSKSYPFAVYQVKPSSRWLIVNRFSCISLDASFSNKKQASEWFEEFLKTIDITSYEFKDPNSYERFYEEIKFATSSILQKKYRKNNFPGR